METFTATARSEFGVWVDEGVPFSASRFSELRHNFHQHPLMQLPALAKLATRLVETEQCRFIMPGAKLDSEFDHASSSPDGRGVGEVFDRIEEPGSWVALYNVQTDPEYRSFVEEVASSVRPLVEAEQPGMYNVGGFIFISAPPAVTPFHIDRENNFWLQVRGQKTMYLWDHRDRSVVGAEDVDSFIVHGGLNRVKLRDGAIERASKFVTQPGVCLYFPSTSPHMTESDPDWVTPGDGVSISIGVVFYTAKTRSDAYIHAANNTLRRFGFKPSLPGATTDGLKGALGRAIVSLRSRFRGYVPNASFKEPGAG